MSLLENYKQNHQHPINRAIHTVGVPLIVLSMPIMVFNRNLGLGLWIFGWVIQFIGHGIEGSSPAILSKGASPVANMVGSIIILIAVPLFAWHWKLALGLIVLSFSLSLIGNLIKGVPVADLTQTGPAYFIGGMYWWIKKTFSKKS